MTIDTRSTSVGSASSRYQSHEVAMERDLGQQSGAMGICVLRCIQLGHARHPYGKNRVWGGPPSLKELGLGAWFGIVAGSGAGLN